jgi:hypothetical protein
MNSSIVASIMSGLSKAEIKTIAQLLSLQQSPNSVALDSVSTVSLVDDYLSDDEEENTPKPYENKRSPGRPKKVLTAEEQAKKDTILPRGRPMKIRSPEELAVIHAALELKETRRKDREAKQVEKLVLDGEKKERVRIRSEAAQVKKAESAEKTIAIFKKRTEIHEKMLADAAEYKAKWSL